jgi:hypothetical protein
MNWGLVINKQLKLREYFTKIKMNILDTMNMFSCEYNPTCENNEIKITKLKTKKMIIYVLIGIFITKPYMRDYDQILWQDSENKLNIARKKSSFYFAMWPYIILW